MNIRKFAPLVALALATAGWAAITGSARADWPGDDYEPTWDKIKRTGVMKVACVNHPPYNGQDPQSGEWKGFQITMAKEVARLMDVEWECVKATWGNASLLIQSGKADVMFSYAATPKRAMTVDFVGPVYNLGYLMVNRKGFNPGDRWEDYDKPEVRVAVIVGTSNELVLNQVLPNATKVGLDKSGTPSMAVSAGRADAFLASVISGTVAASKNPDIGDVTIPKPIASFPSYTAVRQEPDRRFATFLKYWVEWNRLRGEVEIWVRDALVAYGIAEEDLPEKLYLQ